MSPRQHPLPYRGDFSSAEEYTEKLLQFASTTRLFQTLCGGIHILDFFTSETSLFEKVLPEEWHDFLRVTDMMSLLDLLMRDKLESAISIEGAGPPASLLEYIKSIRNLSLGRDFRPPEERLPDLPRSVAVGMRPKKMHEVKHFANYVQRLSNDIAESSGGDISHFVDFGSGQNYLGRALASEPYNRRVVAVEGRESNVTAAKGLDRLSGLAVKQKVMRNKKLWNQILAISGPSRDDRGVIAEAAKQVAGTEGFDFRPMNELGSTYAVEEGKGHIQYVSGHLDNGELGDVVSEIENGEAEGRRRRPRPRLMAVSIHSCGNLSHFGIRSLVLNPEMRAIAIVGCCYNRMTEKLGPPTYKHPHLRPNLQALNRRAARESDRRDPQGFPMSDRFSTYQGEGVRLNITTRMMACQAPQNWTREDSERFFTRHFFRAVLQKMFLDRGVVDRIHQQPTPQQPTSGSEEEASTEEAAGDLAGDPASTCTSPVTIGALGKSCYRSIGSYVRGAIEKLTTNGEYQQHAQIVRDKMADVTDEEIDAYEAAYLPRRKELCVMWSLMAFSATVVEALIVTDRWTYLKEQSDVVSDAWVETVFDFGESPRNLVVVGVKRADADVDAGAEEADGEGEKGAGRSQHA
ncbi:hypothetical protein RJ55_05369 [Drechmeria coniospora]|nr:hypothetical protein RJ55_05369 [Drechmeria coniospora]